MKATLSCAVVCLLLLCVGASAFAATYSQSWSPNPPDLYDLEHAKYYSWGISFTLAPDKEITEATLSISSLNNWTWENGDTLYIHLLDSPSLGVRVYSDTDSTNGMPPAHDNWGGVGVVMDAYHDYNENVPENKTYTFSNMLSPCPTADLRPTLTSYIQNNSRFGFGLDPDCHYYNCGVTFTIQYRDKETPPVPEPTGLVALGAGMMSLCGLISRRKKL